MLRAQKISLMIGLNSTEAFEIIKYKEERVAEKESFTQELTDWMHENISCLSEPVLNADYYDSLVSGTC